MKRRNAKILMISPTTRVRFCCSHEALANAGEYLSKMRELLSKGLDRNRSATSISRCRTTVKPLNDSLFAV